MITIRIISNFSNHGCSLDIGSLVFVKDPLNARSSRASTKFSYLEIYMFIMPRLLAMRDGEWVMLVAHTDAELKGGLAAYSSATDPRRANLNILRSSLREATDCLMQPHW